MFVILDIKFGVANIKWNLCQNTVKFQNMTNLVGKICSNIQTSKGYYLLHWVLASVCSCSQKSWILFIVSTCRAVRAGQFSETYMNDNDFAAYCHKFFCLCAWQVWFYLMLSKLNPSFNVHKEHLVLSRIIKSNKIIKLKKYLTFGVWNLKISFVLLEPKHLSHNLCPEP